MRIYLPASPKQLARLVYEGSIAVPVGHCVTPSFERLVYAQCGIDDAEEIEYQAFLAAAEASIGLVTKLPGEQLRRVVISVDITLESPALDRAGQGLVALSDPVERHDVVSVHIDEISETVTMAIRRVSEADTEERPAALDALEEIALLWYDASELDDLVS